MFSKIDHLIFAAPTLESGMDAIEKKLGIRPVYGGQHLGRGTHNALLALGENTYFEVIAPDPSQFTDSEGGEHTSNSLWMNTHLATQPRMWTWAAKSNNLFELEKIARLHDIPFGKIESGTRTQPNGNILSWQLSLPVAENEHGIIPFFLNWGNTIHPAKTLPQAGEILEFKIYHPQPTLMHSQFEKLGLEVVLEKGEQPKLEATIKRLDGRIVKL